MATLGEILAVAMNTLSRPLLLALAVLVGACSSSYPPVAVVAGQGASGLAGVWVGTYSSRDTGRSGDIYFALSARADSAVGDVLMATTDEIVTVDAQADGTWRWRGASPSMAEVIAIRFVRLGADEVVGDLAPYRDPDCGCLLRTTFRGRVEGDRVSGTFRSEGEAPHSPASGTWSAERRPADS